MLEVNYAALEHAQGQMKTLSHQIDEKLDTLRAGLQKMRWDGADREAYDEHQRAWDAAVTDLNGVLGQIAAAVGLARENYINTEASNSKLF
ncbi:hypothetical protein Lfu02_50210 [Longispora fulva]|uniref:ESAT-6-like protein n=1 Tax=Longispora fulva TaxID=619741 RepID=A0A8J7GPM0_9ACTN|nr:WXG100 family type VII secretion target [Longispora fulva]MBG6141082.1 WXG100 family type VII secretion target [Longispora fulva]GIG60649.1 hypothetical protein Lfu02_50210 [Longispora fulva]